ncbi:rhomboid family intramembrane serine protease [Paludibacter sp. 221]|uniref:rhomboid family intramembrane serine protease n=1 Tax=Paludibacter sp. 221 TaxID=2302939 RepID=UPI0013D10CFE|nr:rhomboid family intramembrane serine protease [Paludibacter sp. 221]NDV47684.1 rhomboid family intramembrane serine protease [Paludibacter sp. 221]
MPPVVKNLIIINFILWLATIVVRRWGIDLNNVLGMHYWASDKFNPVQLVTYMFMHGGLSHVFFNMFAVYMFGSALEQAWGSKRFLFYYMVTGIGAGIIQQIVYTIEFQPAITTFNNAISDVASGGSIEPYKDFIAASFKVNSWNAVDTPLLIQMKADYLSYFYTVGASGSVFGILLAFGMLFPNTNIYIMFIPIPIKAKYFVVGYGLIELYLGFANRAGDSIAHFAHVGGMLFGIILILYWKKKGRLYN